MLCANILVLVFCFFTYVSHALPPTDLYTETEQYYFRPPMDRAGDQRIVVSTDQLPLPVTLCGGGSSTLGGGGSVGGGTGGGGVHPIRTIR